MLRRLGRLGCLVPSSSILLAHKPGEGQVQIKAAMQEGFSVWRKSNGRGSGPRIPGPPVARGSQDFFVILQSWCEPKMGLSKFPRKEASVGAGSGSVYLTAMPDDTDGAGPMVT
jgi:hypothetical protein